MTSNSLVPSLSLESRMKPRRARAAFGVTPSPPVTSLQNRGLAAQPDNFVMPASDAAPDSAHQAVLPERALPHLSDGPPIGFWTIREVESAVKLKKSAIYARISRRSFPPPVKLSPTVSVWVDSVVRAWMRDAALHRART